MNEARVLIEREIAKGGPISFARFMELALYHPEFGYYESGPERIGKAGDYLTSVSVGPAFGVLLAFEFCRWLGELGSGPVCLVEGGAHDGRLAADILDRMSAHRPALYEHIEYCILEPSSRRRDRQANTLESHLDRVRWHRGWDSLTAQGVRGVVFCNELLDAMPAHRLGWDAREQRWFEYGVSVKAGAFAWTRLPTSESSGADALRLAPAVPERLAPLLPDGYAVEVSPAALAWWAKAAGSLSAGRLVAIDYGFVKEQLLSPERAAGTLRAYSRHQAFAGLFERAGDQDLTAHVDFDALKSAGEEAGLLTEALVQQGGFLGGILERAVSSPENDGRWIEPLSTQCKTLLHPDLFGRAFLVLVQRR